MKKIVQVLKTKGGWKRSRVIGIEATFCPIFPSIFVPCEMMPLPFIDETDQLHAPMKTVEFKLKLKKTDPFKEVIRYIYEEV